MATKKSKKVHRLAVDAKYGGKYVAFDPAVGQKAIASGRNAGAVVARARKLGVEVPAIMFVPKRDEPMIYDLRLACLISSSS
jgi:hypothetical protein